MRNNWALMIVAALAAGFALRAAALPIVYTDKITASGSLNGTAFTNALVTLTATADTSGIVKTTPGEFDVQNSLLTVQVAGVGSGTFAGPTVTRGVLGFAGGFDTGTVVHTSADILLTGNNAAFASYNLSTAIGPVASVDGTFGSFGIPFALTGGGTFSFDVYRGFPFGADPPPSTFTAAFPAATSVPEPSTAALGLLALPGLGWWMMKKRKPAAA